MEEAFDRTAGIGGSDIATVLGLDPWRSQWDLWLEKTHDPAWQPQPETAAMRFGKLLEPIVAQLYREETGYSVVLHPEGDRTLWHPNGIMYAHVDGYVYERDNPIATAPSGVFESKVPRSSRDWGSGVPMYYETQARAYREIADMPWVDVAVLFRDSAELGIYRVEYDESIDGRIVRAVENWWEKHVVRGEPPPMDASAGAGRYIANRFPEPTTADIMPYDAAFESLVQAHIETMAAIERHTNNLAVLKNHIRLAMGEYPRAEGEGWHVLFKRNKGASTVAWKEVATAYRSAIIKAIEAEGDSIDRMMELEQIDLDAIQSLYTTVSEGVRPLIVKEDVEK